MILDQAIPLMYILNKVKYDLVAVFFVGIISFYLTASTSNFIPQMPLSIPAFLGTAISILLSFKMNQSYDRWWEARKIWGSIVNDSRTLVIQLQSFLPAEEEAAIKKISFRQIAWCYSLGRSLRGLNATEGIEGLIDAPEHADVLQHNNKPLALLQLHAKDIRLLRHRNLLDSFTHVRLDATITRLTDAMGKAERINGTVFPSSYRQFLHFIIYLFVVTLSIALHEVDILFEIPLLLVISLGFFLIEKSAYHLQDPFRNRPSDVSVTAIARTIDINIRQLLGEREVPEPLQPEGFYIL